MKGKIVIEPERCKGCSLCISACPKKLISISKQINSYGYYPAMFESSDSCTGCTLCAITCPDNAIEVYREAGYREEVKS